MLNSNLNGGGARQGRLIIIATLLPLALLGFGAFPVATVAAQARQKAEAAPKIVAALPVTLSDVALKEIDGNQFRLRLQADGPLAFDRIDSGANRRQVVVRFYNVRLGSLPPAQNSQFGTLSWSDDGRGNLLLRLDLATAYVQASLVQAGHPNIAEIRLRS